METIKQYPIIDGNRTHYVRLPIQVKERHLQDYPIKLEVGKWIAVNVALKGYIPLIAPMAFDTEEECQLACDIHNSYHKFTEDQIREVITESMQQMNYITKFLSECGVKRAATVLLIFLSLVIKSQTACDSIFPPINYSTGSHTFCVPGTVNPPGQGTTIWVRITPQYVDTLNTFFEVNGVTTQTATYVFYPGAPGLTTFRLWAWTNFHGVRCFQEIAWTFTTIVCAYGSPVGIEEYDLPETGKIYFDLQGNRIEKRYNELIIEQAGNRRRKIYITQ